MFLYCIEPSDTMNPMGLNWKRLQLLVSLPAGVLVIGIVGFMLLEHLPFTDALYFTVVTITTVGYGDIHPTTVAGKMFSIFLIVIGIGTFLTIITNLTQMLIQRGQNRLRRRRLNMMIGVFFTEVGNHLLHMFTSFDPNVGDIRGECTLEQNCSEMDFVELRKLLRSYKYPIDPTMMDLESVIGLLMEKGDFLIRQVENSDMIEHESYTELLWEIIHIRDELISRVDIANLPESDLEHLSNDIRRAYADLVKQWLGYMQHLRRSYPYLFSLALRTNPFKEHPSAFIAQDK